MDSVEYGELLLMHLDDDLFWLPEQEDKEDVSAIRAESCENGSY